VATGACWLNASGDSRVMECDLFVRRGYRRRGIASRLLSMICDATTSEGRTLLTWSSFGAVPAGEAFARRVGATLARVNRTSELRLADVDWDMVGAWIDGVAERASGYRIDWHDGPFPPEVRADAATFHHIMQTAPRDDLDMGDVHLTVDNVAELDRALVEAGRDRWALFVRAPDGACVGGTEVLFEPWEPATGLQQNTAIDPTHRGRGLAKWAKAAMLERIRQERRDVQRMRTGNAFSNAPMLAINDALGFRVTATQTEWQATVATVQRALDQ
jgi:mycothiol synthase